MRFDESEIWGLYMESKKVGKKKNDAEKKEKNDKKEEGKGKSKKGKIPPQFLKNIKKKKAIKEEFDTEHRGYGKMSADEYSTVAEDIHRALNEIAEKSDNHRAVCEYLQSQWADNEQAFYDALIYTNEGEQDVGDINDLESGEDLSDKYIGADEYGDGTGAFERG